MFIAEAYWDMECALQQQGFDYCYDKRLYDRLAHEGAASVRGHLQADLAYQQRLLRFIENHDEPRAATALGDRHRAAAVVMSTVPGARLYHDGQFEGRREHIPVFVDRAPDEPPDDDLRAFYARLLRAARELRGEWRLCDCENPQLVAWAWAEHLVVVNLGPTRARGGACACRGRATWCWRTACRASATSAARSSGSASRRGARTCSIGRRDKARAATFHPRGQRRSARRVDEACAP